MFLSHPGNNNSKVDSNPNSHELLKPRKSNPLAGRGTNSGLIFSVVWVSPCPPSCPGSTRARCDGAAGDVTASSRLPRPSPKIWQEAKSVCASAAAAHGLEPCCSLGRTPKKSIYHLLQEGKQQRETRVVSSGVFRRIDLCVCVCVLLCSL